MGCDCVEGQGGCVDLWRDDSPAHGENGTYNAYTFTKEAMTVINTTDISVPLFLYAAFQEVQSPTRSDSDTPNHSCLGFWHQVHGPYEVPNKYRTLFPTDPDCVTTAKDNPTCCGYTDHAHSPCTVWGVAGTCKCSGGSTAHENMSLACPPGGQCSREYMLSMIAVLDDAVSHMWISDLFSSGNKSRTRCPLQIANITDSLRTRGRYNNSIIVFSR